jgi:hypothetical protein
MKTLLILFFLLAAISPDLALASKQLACKLEPTEDSWDGSCGKLNGRRLYLSINEGESITSGIWRSGREPVEVWSGDMKHGERLVPPVEIERYQTGVIFARTTFGWFQVSDWSHSKDVLKFIIHAEVEVAPSKLDFLIVRRADEILVSENVWNREDNRKCSKEATIWSIYCALRLASVEVSGGSHHRRPALQVVRKIVLGRAKNRGYRHSLMDYNNDESTHIEDVHSLFKEAKGKIWQSLQGKGK